MRVENGFSGIMGATSGSATLLVCAPGQGWSAASSGAAGMVVFAGTGAHNAFAAPQRSYIGARLTLLQPTSALLNSSIFIHLYDIDHSS
ncbi:MAG: hypothetical protein ACOH2B_01285 [Burkholderiaceae bacterium]